MVVVVEDPVAGAPTVCAAACGGGSGSAGVVAVSSASVGEVAVVGASTLERLLDEIENLHPFVVVADNIGVARNEH